MLGRRRRRTPAVVGASGLQACQLRRRRQAVVHRRHPPAPRPRAPEPPEVEPPPARRAQASCEFAHRSAPSRALRQSPRNPDRGPTRPALSRIRSADGARFAPWSPRHPLASESTRQRAFAVVGRSGQARHLPLPTPDPAGAEVRGGGSSGVCQRPAGSPASALGGPRQKRGHDQPSAGCERLAAASAGMGVRRVVRSESHASSNAWRSSPMSCLQGIIRLDSLRSVTLRNSASKL